MSSPQIQCYPDDSHGGTVRCRINVERHPLQEPTSLDQERLQRIRDAIPDAVAKGELPEGTKVFNPLMGKPDSFYIQAPEIRVREFAKNKGLDVAPLQQAVVAISKAQGLGVSFHARSSDSASLAFV